MTGRKTERVEGILRGILPARGRSCAVPICAMFGLLLLIGMAAERPAYAGHDLGKQCYVCHNIESGRTWPGSYSVWDNVPIGMGSYGRPLTCDVCHTEYGERFMGGYSSKHPVRVISGTSTAPDNTSGTVYGTSPLYIDCRDCHSGSGTVASPDLSPDVSPLSYTLADARYASDGYPNHDNTIVGYAIDNAVWSGQNVVTGGTDPHLGLTYTKSPVADNSGALSSYALCFSCHDGSAGKTNRRVDVKTKYTQGSGHYYKSTLNRMPCSDCHTTHNSSSSRLYAKPANAGTPGAVVYTAPGANPSLASDVRKLCNDCHDDHGAGNPGNGKPLIRGVEPSPRTWGVAEHDSGSLVSCTTSGCHDAHDAPAKCNSCHGVSSNGSGRPPDSPKSGNRVWSSSVDRVGQPLTQGLHRVADNNAKTDHEGFGCAECHTSTPGSGAGHNVDNANATMTNLLSRKWTDNATTTEWRKNSDGADNSVVDDSCNNANCHSPYYNGNAAKSGTPFPYARYWENYNLWDCYTCHGYRDVPDNTNNPEGLDRRIETGSHGRHIRTTANGGVGLDCLKCHETGNATKYSASRPGSDNAYPGTHKTGYVDWNFAGSPNPYGVAAASRQYSNSQLGGTGVPTDNVSGRSCKNLYCHSIGQTASGGVLTADNTAEYRQPRWDNTFGGKCGDCHRGDGATDNASSVIASGSHPDHVGAAGALRYACGMCHTGGGRDNASLHADNGVHLGFGSLNGVSLDNTSYSQGKSHVVGNGFGNCTSNYCHGTDPLASRKLSGGANQAGTPNLPAWGSPGTGLCGSCHGGPNGDNNYPAKASNWPTDGAHGRHMDNTDAAGPRMTSCTDCHTSNGAATHVDGKVDFRTSHTDNTGTTLVLTKTCDPCHGSGVAAAKANWPGVVALDCLTCHGSSRATTYADNTGRVAPNVGGDNSTYGAAVTGHNRPVGSYGSGNSAANLSCAGCHKLTLAHIDNADGATYAGNRLLDNVQIASGVYVTVDNTLSGLCNACHANAASQAASKRVNTHGNAGYADNLELAFSTTCDQCHEPHGMVNVTASPSGVNLWMIDPSIRVTSGVWADNVRLFSRTGANSFDNTGTASDLCRACHANASNPGYPVRYNVAGQHATPSYTGDERGKDCSGCHSHNQDDNTATVDGLMAMACNACHSYPGLDNTSSKKQMSAGHAEHAGTPSGTSGSRGYACTVCHYNYDHNQSKLVKGQDWPANYDDNVNVNFAASWNPGSPTYGGQAVPTTGNGGSGSCGGLYCHGDNPSLNGGWNGSDNTPVWNVPSTGSCGTCHDAGTADTTQGTVFSTKNHPAHLSASYGPGLAAFGDNNCSNGSGCHPKIVLSPSSTHVNNAKELRQTATDNGEVSSPLSSTQVCRNCHSGYASSAGTGDNLVRTQSNWDNASYKVPCLTCHNNGTQGTKDLSGGTEKAPNVEAMWSTSGHGASSIDNNSTTDTTPPRYQNVPVPCETCHDEGGAHIGTVKDATNPWRLDNALTKFAQSGGLDNDCLRRCHAQTGSPVHAWIVSGVGSASRDNAVNTHPSSVAAVGANKGRWFAYPSDNAMPVLADLSTKSPGARSDASVVACVTCHDPHGVGTTPVPAPRTFNGANGESSRKMLRYDYSGQGTGTTPLCAKCHR